MNIKTKDLYEENNDLETNHYFSIPEEIQNEINRKGFYLYEWIGENDVKNSLQIEFLKILYNFGLPAAVLIILPSIILVYTSGTIGYIYFFGGLLLLNIIFIIILSIKSIIKSKDLRDNSKVVLTETHIGINGEIEELNNISLITKLKAENIAFAYEEKIFEKSNIENSRKKLLNEAKSRFLTGYDRIFRMGRGKNGAQLVIILSILYTIYLISILGIYLIGIFIVSIFSVITSIINKKILLLSGHKVTKINDNFLLIDNFSNNLKLKKYEITLFLNDALNNDWKDSLLLKINKNLEEINLFADKSINKNIELKSDIKDSKYSKIFNFNTYNNWIKVQLIEPLEQILLLLNKNLEKLQNQNLQIDEMLKNQDDPSKNGPILASKKRVEIRIDEITKHIQKMNLYINKLK